MAIVDKTLYKEVGRRIYNLRSQHQYTRSYLASQVNQNFYMKSKMAEKALQFKFF